MPLQRHLVYLKTSCLVRGPSPSHVRQVSYARAAAPTCQLLSPSPICAPPASLLINCIIPDLALQVGNLQLGRPAYQLQVANVSLITTATELAVDFSFTQLGILFYCHWGNIKMKSDLS
ncbi:hypothetical protein O0L34_g1198 [Tuta absoluta]|nr:hypothetical protein O0L34_g1198 [Tuta absoluta]